MGICAYTHDSAAALLVDGRLVGFCEEERLNGEKHSKAFPDSAVKWLLSESGLQVGDITKVAYNFQPERYLDALLQMPALLGDAQTQARAHDRIRSFVRVAGRTQSRLDELSSRFPNSRVIAVQHHLAHGLYAYASSGYDQAAVLVADSLGELQSTSIGHARRDAGGGCSYDIVGTIDDPASLGYAYGAITEHLGWRRGDEEGTVMALAALGDPARFRSVLSRAIRITHDGFRLDAALLPLRVLASGYARTSSEFAGLTCPPRLFDEPITEVHQDLAAALQERTEEVMLHLARLAARATRADLLCVSGGIAANCVSIGRIVEAGIFDEVHVPPSPGDSGTAIGAAVSLHLDDRGCLPAEIVDRCYLGPAFPGVSLAEEPRPGMSAHRPGRPAQLLAQKLANGRIVGLVNGPLEAGPRALGNRSILASPLLPDVVQRLNATVKFRESFRPFAPMVLAEKAADYFTLRQRAPYMSIASGVTDLARRKIPAIVHYNGTARVQTVERRTNPFIAEVLDEFANLTGVPVLINTSLNIKGKPICGTPEMALDCLQESGLDALMLEGWWVQK